MKMKAKKDLTDYKRKYDLFRHHAWAGLGFLSVLGFLRIIFVDLADLLQPILIILIIYVVISLLLTYMYHSGLSAKQEFIQREIIHHTDDVEKHKIHAEVEKERLKLEKKKAKASVKAEEKS